MHKLPMPVLRLSRFRFVTESTYTFVEGKTRSDGIKLVKARAEMLQQGKLQFRRVKG